MKVQLKYHRFNIIAEIQSKPQKDLNLLTENYFQVRFHKWQGRWNQCIAVQDDYFKGDYAKT